MNLVLIISGAWALTAFAIGALARAIGRVAARADAVSAATLYELACMGPTAARLDPGSAPRPPGR